MINELDDQVATLKELVRRKGLNTPTGTLSSPAVNEELSQRKVPHTMAITSGKGGVGKTLVTVNLAIQFARQGLKVLLIDADLGLANIDVVLGMSTPQYTIQDVLEGNLTLDQVAVEGPEGITVLPAASGVTALSVLTEEQKIALMDHIDHWNADFDVVLVDTGAGISENVRFFVLAVERIMVVATPDPTSVTDAYALMKVLFLNHRASHFDLVVNQVRDEAEAKEVYRTLAQVADKFLNIVLNFVGFIPEDTQLAQSVRQQKPVSIAFPNAPVSLAFHKMSKNLLRMWQQKRHEEGRMIFFWRRLLKDAPGQSES
ncbi:MAG: MinD/ParA family protein [Magnetococcales bacterium]|nr:MinD/ParA family protein [Magnetococcales bacterium]MBF0439179.1 MinD/ParA family protein [Magnetococcales bacterium]